MNDDRAFDVFTICNAYESGVGHGGDNLPNPYPEGTDHYVAYDEGKKHGALILERKAREKAAEPKADDARDADDQTCHSCGVNHAEADALIRDAERYRWMRDVMGESADALVDAIEQYGEEFDKAIDAAMLAAQSASAGENK